MKLILLLIVIGIFYLISRGYKTKDFQNINLKVKENFTGNLYKHEAGLLVSLLAKVSKADGNVSNLEAQFLSNIFTDISSRFENSDEIREKLKQIYQKEKSTFENTIDITKNLYNLTKFSYQKEYKLFNIF